MEPSFKVAEEDGYSLDALLIGEILEALFLDLMGSDAILALLLGFEVLLFELLVRE
jgi:hypothetical protein